MVKSHVGRRDLWTTKKSPIFVTDLFQCIWVKWWVYTFLFSLISFVLELELIYKSKGYQYFPVKNKCLYWNQYWSTFVILYWVSTTCGLLCVEISFLSIALLSSIYFRITKILSVPASYIFNEKFIPVAKDERAKTNVRWNPERPDWASECNVFVYLWY